MDAESIIRDLHPIFQTIFKNPDLVVHENLTADDVEKWDSMTNTLMIDAVEKHFGIKFRFRDIVNMENVSDMVRLIQKYLKA
jgi:acyl carrier protein